MTTKTPMDFLGGLIRFPFYIASRFMQPLKKITYPIFHALGFENEHKFAAFVHACNMAVMGLSIALCIVPNYVTTDTSEASLFDIDCGHDSIDCYGRLMGVRIVTIIAAVFAFFNLGLAHNRNDVTYFTSLYMFGATLTTFFLWWSFYSRVHWTNNGVQNSPDALEDGLVYPLSIANMVTAGFAFLGWVAFELVNPNLSNEKKHELLGDWSVEVVGGMASLLPGTSTLRKSVEEYKYHFTHKPFVGAGPYN